MQELASQRGKLQDEQATLTLQQAELRADEEELRMQKLQLEADQKANAEALQVCLFALLSLLISTETFQGTTSSCKVCFSACPSTSALCYITCHSNQNVQMSFS